ncbi:MAG TPA: YdcF family protein [Patescibacteria group bacterium]|nr:YdcF family protein [Patescibacteria group bacterium]
MRFRALAPLRARPPVALRRQPRAVRPARGERGGLIGRLIGLLFLVVILVALFFARFALMTEAGRWLVVSDALQPSNAIIQLSGDNVEADRAAHAAQLYKQGWAPVIVASGSQIRAYLSEADIEQHDLEADGVPASAIIPFKQKDLYTLQEARDLLVLCRERKWSRVIVVTSNYHTRRSRYIFRHVFPPSIQVRVSPAADAGFHPDGWWKTRLGEKIFFREYAALCVAFWELHEPFHAKSP